jgi:hypothetical protein
VNSQGNQTVTHTYAWPELYQVCMKVTRYVNDGTVCTDSICKTVDLIGVGIFSNNETSINIWPNPVKETLNLSAGDQPLNGTYQVVNLLGEIMLQGRLSGSKTSIQTSDLAVGLYMIQIHSSEGILTRKFMKE